MPARIGLLIVATLLASIWWSPAEARRVALVIGNANYAKVPKLTNPARDSGAVTALLRSAGFELVEQRSDLGLSAMRRALRDFADEVRTAEIAVVYFAGHGIEVNGANYLVPVDAALERDIDVEDETVSLDRVNQILEPARRLRLIILDACRDNPFLPAMKRSIASRSIGRGLARLDVMTSDTLIAYAAKAGSTAADGSGDNSPYTTALMKHLATPGLDIRIAFGRVRDEVLKATGHRQEPFVYGSLGGSEIALVPKQELPVPTPAEIEAARKVIEAERARVTAELALREADVKRREAELRRVEDERKSLASAPVPVQPPTPSIALPAPQRGQTRIDRTFGPGLPATLVALPQGDLVFAMQVVVNKKVETRLMRLAGNGEAVWTRSFQDKLIQSGHLLLDKGGEIILTGEGATANRPIWMVRIDLDGKVLSDVSFDGPPPAFQRMRVIADSTTITVLADEVLQTGKPNAQFFRFDTKGTSIGQHKIDVAFDSAYLLAPLATGGFVASWVSPEDPASPLQGFPVVARFDANGQKLWQERAATSHEYNPSVLTPLADGRVAVAGYLNANVEAGQPSLWFSVLDSGGRLQRSTRFARYSIAVPMTMAALPDGTVAVGGCAEFGDKKDVRDPWIVLLNSSGTEVDEINRPRDKGGAVLSLIPHDGAIAAGGIGGNGCGWFDGALEGAETWVQVIRR